ncbi:MAG: leucyl aminopeptidase, partial [Pseudomonadota bacterium]
MTTVLTPEFIETELDLIDAFEGKLVTVVTPAGGLDTLGRRANKLCKGALARFSNSDAFGDMAEGSVHALDFLPGINASAVIVVKLAKKLDAGIAMRAGAAAAKAAGKSDVMILAGTSKAAAHLAQGYCLASYDFDVHKSGDKTPAGSLKVLANGAEDVSAAYGPLGAVVDGTLFTRDLVNEPSNILTTIEFADRLSALSELGLTVKVLDEPELEKLGMRTLLGVGQGSES